MKGDVRVRISPVLVEIEALLDQSVQRVGRSVLNMRELAVSGLPTSTPGSSSPGGGKGAGRSPVEASVLAGEFDQAALRLTELVGAISDSALAASSVVEQFTGQRPIMPTWFVHSMPLLVHSYRCARLLVQLDVPERWRPSHGWTSWSEPVNTVWRLTQWWGWLPSEPASSKVQRELLATDLTGQWCRSCLRLGRREPRDRNAEFCTWCRKFEQREGFTVPIELVEAHHDNEYNEALVGPYRQAHRERLKRAERGKR